VLIIAKYISFQLNPGWCSAMAQGHGLSVLVRAAQITGEKRFWNAAQLALKPFTQVGFLIDSSIPLSDWLSFL